MEGVDQLPVQLPDWQQLRPEIVVCGGIVALIFLSLFTGKSRWNIMASLLFYLTLAIYFILMLAPVEPESTVLFTFDRFGALFKSIAAGAMFFISVFYLQYFYRQYPNRPSTEGLIILLAGLLGISLLISSQNLLMVYLSAEVISLTSYLLIALGGRRKNAESALKYFLFGGIISAFMLFGISWLYGFTGSLNFSDYEFFRGILLASDQSALPVLIAIVFFFLGIFFKISFVPIHLWIPDTYQGAPSPVAAYLSIMPKLAGFAILVRFLSSLDNVSLIFIETNFNFQSILSLLAILTLLISNIIALRQKDIKRILAYSSISHSAFMAMALLSFSEKGLESFYFYLIIYSLANVAAFYLSYIFSDGNGNFALSRYQGQGSAHPILSVLWVLVLISLIGLPPAAGFTAKFLVFANIWETFTRTQNSYILYLLVTGIVSTAISLFYYLKIPYFLFFKTSDQQIDLKMNAKIDILVISFIAVLLILLFIFPGWLINFFVGLNFIF